MSYENLPKNITNQAVLVRGGRPDYTTLSTAAFPTPTADEIGSILEHIDTGDRFRWSSTGWYKTDIAAVPKVHTELTKGVEGSLIIASLLPVFQMSAKYGLIGPAFTLSMAGATTTVIDDKFTCQTGTSANGGAVITSRKQLHYREGQGSIGRLSAIFSTGVADSEQHAGLISAENLLCFGYEGADFGIIYRKGGTAEVQELTLTVAAGSESVTVTIDGIVYTVPLSGTGTVEEDAFEIAESLQSQVPLYYFTSNGDQVVSKSILALPQGAFAYSSAGSSVGSWAVITSGVAPTSIFINQADWNKDTKADLNPQLGNMYQIKFQDTFGAIDFFVVDEATGDYTLVHRIANSNTSIDVNVNVPIFRLGWVANNTGNTTNIIVSGANCSIFTEGLVNKPSPRTVFKEQLAIGNSLTSVLAVRNRRVFGTKTNRSDILLSLLTASTQSIKGATFVLVLDPVFGSPVQWSYTDKETSISEVSTDKISITGGINLIAIEAAPNSSSSLKLSPSILESIIPGSVLCIAAIVSSGPASDCQASLSWQEDI